MTRTTSKLVETLTGTGHVLRNDAIVATVSYHITIYQEMRHEGNETIPGLKDITGQLVVLDSERDLVNGEEMVLVLKDGRKAHFLADSSGISTAAAHIHVNGISG